MRILFISDQIPYPLYSGAALRIYNLVERTARAHEVWFAAFATSEEQMQGAAVLQNFCETEFVPMTEKNHALDQPRALLGNVLRGIPPEWRFFASKELASKILSWVEKNKFDLVQIEHSHMGQYHAILPHELQRRTLWMLHDIDWWKFAQLSKLEKKRARKVRLWLHSQMLRNCEPRMAEAFARCLTVSEQDALMLCSANPNVRVNVVPNGVDAQLYQPLNANEIKPALIFVGDMAYRPCADGVLWFCREMLPALKAAQPDIQIWIVGTNPPPQVREFSGAEVHVTGRVEDVRPFYAQSAVAIVPLRAGSGTRLKILEAMALGRPVVSTTIGCEGLDVTGGKDLLIADSTEQFVSSVTRLLQDQMLWRQIVRRARERVTRCYDWNVIAAQLMRLYSQVADSRSISA